MVRDITESYWIVYAIYLIIQEELEKSWNATREDIQALDEIENRKGAR